jgi:hypothetical protein
VQRSALRSKASWGHLPNYLGLGVYGHGVCLHSLHKASLAPSFAKTLQEYQALESKSELWDLSQVPSHGHTSTSLADGSMMCLTTNMPYVYNTTLHRIFFPEEALTAMGVPVLRHTADIAGVPSFLLADSAGQDISYSAKVSIAGNGWRSLKCVSVCVCVGVCACVRVCVGVCVAWPGMAWLATFLLQTSR